MKRDSQEEKMAMIVMIMRVLEFVSAMIFFFGLAMLGVDVEKSTNEEVLQAVKLAMLFIAGGVGLHYLSTCCDKTVVRMYHRHRVERRRSNQNKN